MGCAGFISGNWPVKGSYQALKSRLGRKLIFYILNIMDPISDMLIRIKNAQAVKAEQVVIPFSGMKLKIANILKNSGYVFDVERKKKKSKKTEHEYLNVTLKYSDNFGALSGIKIISRPSRRMYIKEKEIRPVRSGYGLAIVSTSKGIMNSKEAVKQKLGGELICEVW